MLGAALELDAGADLVSRKTCLTVVILDNELLKGKYWVVRCSEEVLHEEC